MSINITELFLPPSTTILDAMRVIGQGAAQVALVVDDHQRLLGTLTDGDVRRGLLHGASLQAPIEQLMNRQFRFVSTTDNHSAVRELMKREVLRQIPVLDDQGRVIELLLLQELLTAPKHTNPIVIMAGGKGTRLRPYTESCPKPMLLVGGKPMLEILLEQCIEHGFTKFYFSVNYLKEQIINHFGDGSRWGVSITYLVETEPLGTAGSLQLLPNTLDEPFLVLNGDVLTRLKHQHILHFHREHNADATICVLQHQMTVPFGVVQSNGVELSGFEEKPTNSYLVNAGVYILHPKILSLLAPSQFIDMPSLLLAAQEAGHRIVVCPIHEYWIDIGRPETLQEAHATWTLDHE